VNGVSGTDVLNVTLANGAADLDAVSNIDTVNITMSGSAAVTMDADADVLDGINTATKVNFLGGNALSTFSNAGLNDTLLGDSAAGNNILDFSGYNGRILDITFAADDFDNDTAGRTVQVIGTSNTDVVSASYGGSTQSVQINTQAVEQLDIDLANSAVTTFDMSLVTGLTTINLSDASSETAVFNSLATGVTVDVTSDNNTATAVTIAQTDVTGDSDSQTIRVAALGADDGVALTMVDVETLNVSSDTANQVDLELANVSMTTSGATTAVNVTGTNDIEIVSTNADINVIDASTMGTGGAVVQTGRSRTDSVTYTGSSGADTFIMINTADTLTGGSGSDTLDVNKAAILGGLNIDLSNTTDQVISFNGSSSSGTALGFENVLADGYTGSFGAQLSGSSVANTLTGTANGDVISGAAGGDTITGGDGGDTIDVGGANDNVRDTVVFTATSDGAAGGAVTGHDVITGIDVNAGDATDDLIALDGAFETAVDLATAGTLQTTATDGNDVGNQALNLANTDEITVLLDAEVEITAADLTTALLANVIVELDEELDFSAFSNGDTHLFVVNVSATQAGIIYYTDSGGNDTVAAADLQLVGIVTHNDGTNLVAADFAVI
jgi:hypothetical protein